MDILSLFIIIPILTVVALLFVKKLEKVRVISAIGMFIELLLSIKLVFDYIAERANGTPTPSILNVPGCKIPPIFFPFDPAILIAISDQK